MPTHAFAATMGLAFLLAGVAGFIPGVTSNDDELRSAGPGSHAELLGIFEVSVLHNVVHLLLTAPLYAQQTARIGRAQWGGLPSCEPGLAASDRGVKVERPQRSEDERP